jgi:predicted RNA-binding protein associated with RNAse of E/G family
MLQLEDWVLQDFEWDVDSLWLTEPDTWHTVRVGWQDGWEPWGWYVNLEQPVRRTERAVQTMDLMLDVIVEPDRSWRWKDEDELEALVEAGLFAPETAVRVRDEALAVIGRAEAGKPPFGDAWHDWRPDSAWPLPELPPGWNET